MKNILINNKNSYKENLIFLLLGFTLLFLSSKGNDIFLISDAMGYNFDQNINYSSFVLSIKLLSLNLAIVTFLILFFISFIGKKTRQPFYLSPILFGSSLLIYFFRLALEGLDILKLFLAILFNFSFLIFCWRATKNNYSILSNNNSKIKNTDTLSNGILFFSIIFVWVNTLIGLSGQGYIENIPRYFGITGHPNFLGVFSAHCAVINLAFIFGNNLNHKKLLFFIATLILSISLVIASASRTALLMFFLGLILLIFRYFAILKRKKIKPITFIFLILATIISIFFLWDALLLIFEGGQESLSRLGSVENTRKEVWGTLITNFLKYPLIGSGYGAGASESSFLKLIATAGIIPGILLLFSFFITLKKSIKVLMNTSTPNNWAISGIAILSIVTILGSFFEGYLFEQGGVLVLFFLIETWIISTVKLNYKIISTYSKNEELKLS